MLEANYALQMLVVMSLVGGDLNKFGWCTTEWKEIELSAGKQQVSETNAMAMDEEGICPLINVKIGCTSLYKCNLSITANENEIK